MMFRTFSELDLAEMERVTHFETVQSVIGKKFDVDALFASYRGNSLFSIFEGQMHLLQAIFKYLEAKQY